MTLFFVAGLALFIGFFFIFLLSLSTHKKAEVTEPAPLNFDQFKKISFALVDEMKLKVVETETSDNGLDILATNPAAFVGGPLLVRCLYLESTAVVGAPTILEFSNVILQERVSKGIFITTGRFTPDLATISELAPMEFIDGVKLKSLMAEYQIPSL